MPGDRSRALRIRELGFVYEVRQEDGSFGPFKLAGDETPQALIFTTEVDEKGEAIYVVTTAGLARAYEAAFEQLYGKCLWQLYYDKRPKNDQYYVRFMVETRHADGRRKRDKRNAARELYKLWKDAPDLQARLRITVKQGADGLGHALDLRPLNLEVLVPDSARRKTQK